MKRLLNGLKIEDQDTDEKVDDKIGITIYSNLKITDLDTKKILVNKRA